MNERYIKYEPTEPDLILIRQVEAGMPISFSELDMAAPEFRDQVMSYIDRRYAVTTIARRNHGTATNC